MKKNLCIAFILLICGCSKNPSNHPIANDAKKTQNPFGITSSGTNESGADSLSNTNKTEVTKRVSVNSISCALSQVGSTTHFSPSYYTVIGTFPSSSSFPSVVVPKGTWQAGIYAFNNQGDGNLVVYVHSTGKVLWASNTSDKQTRLDLQNDLNLVLYQVNGPPVFESQTYYFKCGSQNPQNTQLVLTVDGDLAIIADGVNGNGSLSTVNLADTRTFGGATSPNSGSFFKLYTTSPGPGTYPFKY
ncbi:hypothetical protein J3L18_09870 [Mucilaginibacter gossypii]|uniref:hypothetical protein n=1 Tax=Mucilaginibacter gossypii TaxID=551996 RepID=UPI000DCD19E5|nr:MULTISPECIES: hypothetical protein [Mucilaginibacter]QTE39337.1 hypothetical protein J3L18_09870 [Mucilaginibacter gossypii]RAV51282.1 hypothetical protein DIU36_25780 [Mucilaginibacter rubeus]